MFSQGKQKCPDGPSLFPSDLSSFASHPPLPPHLKKCLPFSVLICIALKRKESVLFPTSFLLGNDSGTRGDSAAPEAQELWNISQNSEDDRKVHAEERWRDRKEPVRRAGQGGETKLCAGPTRAYGWAPPGTHSQPQLPTKMYSVPTQGRGSHGPGFPANVRPQFLSPGVEALP